jgi:hypothetical protein
MENISIINAMDKDHKKIKNLLSIFEKQLDKDFKKSKESFEKLKWNMEKHFFIEEKVIFNSDFFEEKYLDEMSRVLDDHKELLNLLIITEETLSDNKKPDLSEFKRILSNHSKLEDEILYPNMEDILSKEQKMNIVNRINSMLNE